MAGAKICNPSFVQNQLFQITPLYNTPFFLSLTWNKPWLKVLDYEYQLQKAHCFPDNRASTVITLSYLRKQFPATSFVWIMGADNLVQFMRWQNAPKIARLVDICVMNRPEFTYTALASRSIAALGTRVSTYNLGSSPKRKWAYCFSTRNTKHPMWASPPSVC